MKPQLTSGDWGFLRIESMFFALIINNFIVTVLLEFIININATHYSSANIRPLPGRTVRNPLAGSITNVRNRSVDFDSKPSCWSFIKRTLASLLRKIVSVCQAIPHKLALLVPSCYGTSTARTPVSVSTKTYVNNQVNHHLPNRNNHYDYYVLPRETRPVSQQYNPSHLLNQVSDGEHKTPKPPVAAPRTFKAVPRMPKAAPRTLKPAPLPAGASGQNDNNIVYAKLDLASESKFRTVRSFLTDNEKTIYATIQKVVSKEDRPSLSKT